MGLIIPLISLKLLIDVPIIAIQVLESPFVGFITGFQYNRSLSLFQIHESFKGTFAHKLSNIIEEKIVAFIAATLAIQINVTLTTTILDLVSAMMMIDGEEIDFNWKHSTHTASVHQTVSASATRLQMRYKNTLSEQGINAILDEIIAWIQNADTLTNKTNIAKRCFHRLNNDEFIFEDPESKITINTLLALVWLAIHDDAIRQCSQEDARALLLEALYEIQRGDNLDVAGRDDGQDDRPICPGGTFNKLLEKLVGIHPDAHITFMTKLTASTKLPRVVKEEVIRYLRSLPSAVGDEQIVHRNALIDSIIEGIDAPLWNQISTIISDRMFEEFGALFDNEQTGRSFVDFIAAGQYTGITEKDCHDVRPAQYSALTPTMKNPLNNVNYISRVTQFAVELTLPKLIALSQVNIAWEEAILDYPSKTIIELLRKDGYALLTNVVSKGHVFNLNRLFHLYRTCGNGLLKQALESVNYALLITAAHNYEHPEVFKIVLEQYRSFGNDFLQQALEANEHGALQAVATYGRPEQMSLLLEQYQKIGMLFLKKGLGVTMYPDFEHRPLQRAVMNQHIGVIQALLAQYASFDREFLKQGLMNHHHWAFKNAILSGNADLVTIVLEQYHLFGIDFLKDTLLSEGHDTLVRLISTKHHSLSVAKYLLEYCQQLGDDFLTQWLIKNNHALLRITVVEGLADLLYLLFKCYQTISSDFLLQGCQSIPQRDIELAKALGHKGVILMLDNPLACITPQSSPAMS